MNTLIAADAVSDYLSSSAARENAERAGLNGIRHPITETEMGPAPTGPSTTGQIILFGAAVALVLTLTPPILSLLDDLRPVIARLEAQPPPKPQLADKPLNNPLASPQQRSAPAPALLFDPARERARSRRLGGNFEYITELPPTLLYVEKVASALKEAQLRFGVGKSGSAALLLDFDHKAELVLELEDAVEELKREITADEHGNRHLAGISTIVEAELTGQGFSISPAEPIARTAGSQRKLAWQWTVKPREAGTRTLTATLTAFHVISSVAYPEPITSVEMPLRITRSPWSPALRFFNATGKWLFAGLVIPLAALVIRKYAKETAQE